MEIMNHIRENTDLVKYAPDPNSYIKEILFMGHEIHHLPCLQSHGWIIGRKQDLMPIIRYVLHMKTWESATEGIDEWQPSPPDKRQC